MILNCASHLVILTIEKLQSCSRQAANWRIRLSQCPTRFSTANQHPHNWSTQLMTHCLNAILHNPNHVLGRISTAIVPRFQHNWLLPETATPRENPTFNAVGRCEYISHLDTKFNFGWGSAMRELTALPPQTVAGFKVREVGEGGKRKAKGKGGEWRGREDNLFSVTFLGPGSRQTAITHSFCRVTTKRS